MAFTPMLPRLRPPLGKCLSRRRRESLTLHLFAEGERMSRLHSFVFPCLSRAGVVVLSRSSSPHSGYPPPTSPVHGPPANRRPVRRSSLGRLFNVFRSFRRNSSASATSGGGGGGGGGDAGSGGAAGAGVGASSTSGDHHVHSHDQGDGSGGQGSDSAAQASRASSSDAADGMR